MAEPLALPPATIAAFSACPGMHTCSSVRFTTSAPTGAPQENTWRSSAMRPPVASQYRLSLSQIAGEANACVACSPALSSSAGSADAGREKYMRKVDLDDDFFQRLRLRGWLLSRRGLRIERGYGECRSDRKREP